MSLTSNELEYFFAVVCMAAFTGAVVAQALTPALLSAAKFLTRFLPVPKSHFLEIELLNDEIAFLRQSLIAKESQIKVLTSECL
jgi:hypothetical protein